MVDIYLNINVANLNVLEKQKEVTFLVDTGATRAWISKDIAEELDIDPVATIPVELADGSIKKLKYGHCIFDFGGEQVAGNVIIGPKNCEPLVGTHVLQDFRIIIDMEKHTISRGRAMRAKFQGCLPANAVRQEG